MSNKEVNNEDKISENNRIDQNADLDTNYESLHKKSNNFTKSSSDTDDTDSISNHSVNNLDLTTNSEEEEEKQRLIERVLELQNTLEDLSKKVSEVKEENLKLKSENSILGNYIENLMATSGVFQSTLQKSASKKTTS
jgi:hypothetical protein